MRYLSLFLIAIVAVFTVEQVARAQDQKVSSEVALPVKEKFHLYLLVGQSNMAGRGEMEAQDREIPARVVTLSQDGTWVPAIDPIHFDKPKMAGVGPGRTFGIEMSKLDPDVTIGLIPCAAGGSPIDRWEPGAFHDQTESHPWDDTMKRAKLAMQSGTLKGIFWHQGEGDANESKATVYETRLHDLIRRFREELNAPDVPFIVGQLGQFPSQPWNDAKKKVDAAHRALPEKLLHCGFVSSDGLTDKGDGVHFNAASARELGKRYAKVYVEMRTKN